MTDHVAASSDRHLGEAQTREAEATIGGPWRYERIADASHWLLLDEPAEVNDLLVDFLVD